MKYSLVVANVIILFAGAGVLTVGGLTLANHAKFNAIIGDQSYRAPAIVLLVAGGFIFVFAFLGCCGALKESKCLLILYSILLIVLFLVFLVLGILSLIFFKNDNNVETVKDEMLKSIRLYKNDPAIQESWDLVQRTFKCCGVSTGITDWVVNNEGKIPGSCCKNEEDCLSGGLFAEAANVIRSGYWGTGCLTKFMSGADIIGYVSIGIAAAMIMAIIFTCALVPSIK